MKDEKNDRDFVLFKENQETGLVDYKGKVIILQS